MLKRLSTLLILVIALSLSVVGVASAQGPDPQPTPEHRDVGGGALVQAIMDLAGITPEAARDVITPDVTLNEAAVALGLDPAAVIDAAAAAITTRVEQAVADGNLPQENADAILATLTDDLTALMAEPLAALRQGQDNARLRDRIAFEGFQILTQAVADATGLDTETVLQQAFTQDLSLAEVAAANGADPDAVLAAAVATATAQIDAAVANGDLTAEQGEGLITGLEQGFSQMVQQPMPRPREQQNPVVQAVRNRAMRHLVSAISDATGMTEQEIVEELRQSGLTPAEFIAAQGLDAQAIIDAAIASVNAEVSDLLDGLGDWYSDALDRPLQQPQQRGGPGGGPNNGQGAPAAPNFGA